MTIVIDYRALATAPRSVICNRPRSSSGPSAMPRASTSPAACQGGGPVVSRQDFPRAELPVVGERLPEVGDDRALDPEVEIPFKQARSQPMEVILFDVHAAGKPEAAVDDQDLAMIPQVHSTGSSPAPAWGGIARPGSRPGAAIR